MEATQHQALAECKVASMRRNRSEARPAAVAWRARGIERLMTGSDSCCILLVAERARRIGLKDGSTVEVASSLP
jgi:hypothetical protein